MTSAAWIDVDADLDSMSTHFRNAAAILRRDSFDTADLDGYMASMSFLHAVQSGYTSAEAALLRILDLIEEDRPSGPDWHKVLLRRMSRPLGGEFARPALLSPELAEAMQEVRGFRHIAMHVYERIETERFPAAIEATSMILRELPGAVRKFRQTIDPSPRDGPRK